MKIDTGMGRYGFLPREMDKILSVYQYMDGIAVSGIYTHFACAFLSEKKTREQYEQFRYVVDQIAGKGFETGEPHCCNSAAFFRWPDMHMGGVRIGSAWLGRMSARGNFGLRPGGLLRQPRGGDPLAAAGRLHRVRKRLAGKEAHAAGCGAGGLVSWIWS